MLCAILLGCAPPVTLCKTTADVEDAKRTIWRGEAPGPSSVKSRQDAKLNALKEMLQSVNVSVSSQTDISKRATQKRVGSTLRTKETITVTIKGAMRTQQMDVRGARTEYCQSPTGTIRATVTVSQDELERIKRMSLGHTLIVLQCRSPEPGECQRSKLHDRLRKAVVDADLKPVAVLEPEKTMSPNNPGAMKRLGRRHDAAYVLWVSLEGRNRCGTGECKDRPLFAAVTTASFSLVESGDGKAIHSWSSPDDCKYRAVLPSRYYTFRDALEKSMDDAISGNDTCGDGIQQGLATWKKTTTH